MKRDTVPRSQLTRIAGADNDVGEAIAVDVTCFADPTAREIAGIDAVEPEAIRPVESGKIKVGGQAIGGAKHHVAFANVAVIPDSAGATRAPSATGA
ncbi:MAG: hypothetical protein AAGF91_17400, partial [Actinomycetota bacterium]